MSITKEWSQLEYQIMLVAADKFRKNKTPQERKKLVEEKFNFIRAVLKRKNFDRSLEEIKDYYQKCMDSCRVQNKDKNPGSTREGPAKRKLEESLEKKLPQPVTKRQRTTTTETNPNNFTPEHPGNLEKKEIKTERVLINENKNSVNDIVDEETGSCKGMSNLENIKYKKKTSLNIKGNAHEFGQSTKTLDDKNEHKITESLINDNVKSNNNQKSPVTPSKPKCVVNKKQRKSLNNVYDSQTQANDSVESWPSIEENIDCEQNERKANAASIDMNMTNTDTLQQDNIIVAKRRKLSYCNDKNENEVSSDSKVLNQLDRRCKNSGIDDRVSKNPSDIKLNELKPILTNQDLPVEKEVTGDKIGKPPNIIEESSRDRSNIDKKGALIDKLSKRLLRSNAGTLSYKLSNSTVNNNDMAKLPSSRKRTIVGKKGNNTASNSTYKLDSDREDVIKPCNNPLKLDLAHNVLPQKNVNNEKKDFSNKIFSNNDDLESLAKLNIKNDKYQTTDNDINEGTPLINLAARLDSKPEIMYKDTINISQLAAIDKDTTLLPLSVDGEESSKINNTNIDKSKPLNTNNENNQGNSLVKNKPIDDGKIVIIDEWNTSLKSNYELNVADFKNMKKVSTKIKKSVDLNDGMNIMTENTTNLDTISFPDIGSQNKNENSISKMLNRETKKTPVCTLNDNKVQSINHNKEHIGGVINNLDIQDSTNQGKDFTMQEKNADETPEKELTKTKKITEARRNYLRQRSNKYSAKHVIEDTRESVMSPERPASPDQEMPEYTSDQELDKKPVVCDDIKAAREPQSDYSTEEEVKQLVQNYLSQSSPTLASSVEFHVKQETTSIEFSPVNSPAALLEEKESSQTPERFIRRKRCKKVNIIGRITRIEKEIIRVRREVIRVRRVEKAILSKLNQLVKSVNNS